MIFHFLFPMEQNWGGTANMKLWKREMNKCSSGKGIENFCVCIFNSFLLSSSTSRRRRGRVTCMNMFEIWNMILMVMQKEREKTEKRAEREWKCIFSLLAIEQNGKRAKYPCSAFLVVSSIDVSRSTHAMYYSFWNCSRPPPSRPHWTDTNFYSPWIETPSLPPSSSVVASIEKFSIMLNNLWWLFATTPNQPNPAHHNMMQWAREKEIEWTEQTEISRISNLLPSSSTYFSRLLSNSLHTILLFPFANAQNQASCKTVFSSNITSFRRKTCFRCMEWTI